MIGFKLIGCQVSECLMYSQKIVKRYEPKVQLAGAHHNPTPGPSDSEFLYGHVWVTNSWLLTLNACCYGRFLICWTGLKELLAPGLETQVRIWLSGRD